MKLATISHSHISPRQQAFFKEVARQGHDVLMLAPGEWGAQRAFPREENTSKSCVDSVGQSYRTIGGKFYLKTCRHMGQGVYDYYLMGAKEAVEDFKPDWLYIQAEPGSAQEEAAFGWNVPHKALFTWENISLKGGLMRLPEYDLVVCGNPEAEALVKLHNPRTLLMLQVGIDTDHFQARPDVPRDVRVGYVGRQTAEKGLPYLLAAWPRAHLLPWTGYRELPWSYSQVAVVVGFSQDVPFWREQAPNYVLLESLSCGCKAVASTTAAMLYWLHGCPGVVFAEGHQQPNPFLDLVKVENLRKAVAEALEYVLVGDEGRQWVVERFSNPVVARKLLEVLNGVQ